uniref:alpha/beta hydrolase n=1 Tax=Herbidospora sakaeratensis TaxID=564415 RepID=UPI0007838C3A|nr:alpha/beta hydrolase [Herbidospora sakaeratensis]
MRRPVLEPAARALADATAQPPFLYGMPPHEARTAIRDLQNPEMLVPGVTRDHLDDANLTIFRPERVPGPLAVVVYLHGGWVFGGEHSHGRLARELALGSGAAVAFVHYGRSPEDRHPMALHETRAALDWLRVHGRAHDLDPTRIAVAGDAEGGTLAAALALLDRRGLAGQLLLCPVTDASFDTGSYREFAEGYFLRAADMRRVWGRHLAQMTVGPLRAPAEDLARLPAALIITAEADVLRDEGEAYAARMRSAGATATSVRYDGVIHGFVVLDALRGTHAAALAIDQAGRFLAHILQRK